MPRPKVKDEDRQRARQACTLCRTSKIRCDARLPCSRCVKQGRPSACRYGDHRATNKQHRQSTARKGEDGLLSPAALPQNGYQSASMDARRPEPNNAHVGGPLQTPSGGFGDSPETTQSRLMRSARGERGGSTTYNETPDVLTVLSLKSLWEKSQVSRSCNF